MVKDFDHDLPPVPLYGAEINQVWTNLIDNAIQAMNGEGRLTITTSRENDCVRVEIGDTGPGIPEDLQQRIFEPFFTTKAVGEGTGLGLDISYRIVATRHGGDITRRVRAGRHPLHRPAAVDRAPHRPDRCSAAPATVCPRIAGRCRSVGVSTTVCQQFAGGGSIRVVALDMARCTPRRRAAISTTYAGVAQW